MINFNETTDNTPEQLIEIFEWVRREALQSTCLRARCGTVILRPGYGTVQERIIGAGYNSPAGKEPERCSRKHEIDPSFKSDRTCCVHAEQRAIMDALRTNPDYLSKSILYFGRVDDQGNLKTSGKPYCTICSKMALDVGIGSWVLSHDTGFREYPSQFYNDLSFQYKRDK